MCFRAALQLEQRECAAAVDGGTHAALATRSTDMEPNPPWTSFWTHDAGDAIAFSSGRRRWWRGEGPTRHALNDEDFRAALPHVPLIGTEAFAFQLGYAYARAWDAAHLESAATSPTS